MASQPVRQPTVPDQVGGQGMEADETIDDEGYAQSTTTSYVSSLASNIRRGIAENGRIYPDYGKHLPSVPMDDFEKDRNDLQHCKFNLIYSGRLHLAPIGDMPQNILDLGTGTGIWAIDMADKYPTAKVVGVDIAPTQSTFVPPNCEFEIEDIETDWTWQINHFDYIHGRDLLFAIRDWPKLIAQCFKHLKPGGHFELAGTVPRLSCDDGTLPPNTAHEEVVDIYFEIGEAVGASAHAPTRWKRQLEDANFLGVHETIFKMPTSPWPKDKRMKEIGAFELVHFRDTIEGLFLRGYTQVLKRDPKYLQKKLAQTKAELSNRKMHTYIHFYNVYGRKPY